MAQIYEFVCKYFPFYKNAPSSWKNSIRHTLNFNKWFKKMEAPNSYNSGAYCDTSNYKYKKRYVWAINPNRILKVDSEIQKWSKMDKNDTLKVIEVKKLESEVKRKKNRKNAQNSYEMLYRNIESFLLMHFSNYFRRIVK